MKMINSFDSDPKLDDFLHNAFNCIDIDHNGLISHKEAKKAVKAVNKRLGTNYDTSYISKMDTNEDGFVDFKEFSKGFNKAFNMDKNVVDNLQQINLNMQEIELT